MSDLAHQCEQTGLWWKARAEAARQERDQAKDERTWKLLNSRAEGCDRTAEWWLSGEAGRFIAALAERAAP